MADEKKFNMSGDEYKIPEEEGFGEPNEQVARPLVDNDHTLKQSMRGKRLLMPVVLVVTIFIFYQIFSWYYNRMGQQVIKEEQEVARKIQQNSAVLETKAAKTDSAIAPPSPAELTKVNQQDIQNKLEILANKTESNSKQLEKLQENLSGNQNALGTLNRSVADLSSSVQSVSKQVEQLSKPKPKPKKSKKIKRVEPMAMYHVKAIVPGLAWLESSKGESLSVRVGDKMEGYGIVQLISPKQGMVITSNGSTIQYGVNDF